MKIRLLFAWYDLWVGVFVDRPHRRIYILPLPCIGVCLDFGAADRAAGEKTDG